MQPAETAPLERERPLVSGFVTHVVTAIPIVAFTSGKGGCGKTTIAMNFANIVAQSGRPVLLVDLDLSNRGLTGALSKEFLQAGTALTSIELLRLEPTEIVENAVRVHRLKNGVRVIPAGFLSEKRRSRPAAEPAVALRRKLSSLAQAVGASCVVLDCFSGVDELTTAAATAADQTILVNEPDIVTFTGTLNLIRHIRQSFVEGQHQPHVHVVLNRVRAKEHVSRLEDVYRDNIARQLGEPALAYFPYNERLARNFGLHPFPSELLPGSLFTRKLEALARKLFIDEHPDLVKRRVRRWSRFQTRSVYNRLKDPTAVDAEVVLLTLTRFATFLPAILLVFGLWSHVQREFGPREAIWFSAIGLGVLLPVVLFGVLRPLYQTARLNFGLGAFLRRLGASLLPEEGRWEKRMESVTYTLTGLMLSLSVLLMIGLGIVFGAPLVKSALDEADRTRLALSLPFIEVIDLRGREATDLADRMLYSGDVPPPECTFLRRCIRVGEQGGSHTLLQGGTLRHGQLGAAALDGLDLDGVLFATEGEQLTFNTPLRRTRIVSPRGVRALTFGDVVLENLVLELSPDVSVSFSGSVLNNVLIRHRAADRVETPTRAAASDGSVPEGVGRISFSGTEFKEQVTLKLEEGTLVEVSNPRYDGQFTQLVKIEKAPGAIARKQWAPLILPVVVRSIGDQKGEVARFGDAPVNEQSHEAPVSSLSGLVGSSTWPADESIRNSVHRLQLLNGGSSSVEEVSTTYLRALSDLIEMLLVRGAREDLRQAEALIGWINANDFHPRYRGYGRMLELLRTVILYGLAEQGPQGATATQQSAVAEAAKLWGDWLRQFYDDRRAHGTTAREWSWAWTFWNENAWLGEKSKDAPVCAKRLAALVQRAAPARESSADEKEATRLDDDESLPDNCPRKLLKLLDGLPRR